MCTCASAADTKRDPYYYYYYHYLLPRLTCCASQRRRRVESSRLHSERRVAGGKAYFSRHDVCRRCVFRTVRVYTCVCVWCTRYTRAARRGFSSHVRRARQRCFPVPFSADGTCYMLLLLLLHTCAFCPNKSLVERRPLRRRRPIARMTFVHTHTWPRGKLILSRTLSPRAFLLFVLLLSTRSARITGTTIISFNLH